ncbi:hypothetical protein RESH_04367 [Rhodopirellula europaea SH398]|uniref:Uncharacterized protein n=1 Tax=Rhodopirellula europaea SH398 TaxID=1263868 RepID=M5SFX2_9BACT|nr:hypothetical protein RESH_04367 [Rhodopirellula europaea SH398]
MRCRIVQIHCRFGGNRTRRKTPLAKSAVANYVGRGLSSRARLLGPLIDNTGCDDDCAEAPG